MADCCGVLITSANHMELPQIGPTLRCRSWLWSFNAGGMHPISTSRRLLRDIEMPPLGS
ncbi:hypothetical protein BDV30DRAFT_211346 [Aspergillus minisclerotigenes]|uniref:Uncharacterized protein n=1 Tax=Aspergillus minisclerotigenes TaxID=656917 RepID=A0A5N6J293_9EURO|nr:hypothetical protein BDV30DRAFT_211346 [Aspergillus minisclerotigenes]